jgi:hypothetical protein
MRRVAQWVGLGLLAAISDCGGISKEGTDAPGSADPCSPYQDVAATSDVVIRIVNRRSAAVYQMLWCDISFDVEAEGVAHPGEIGRTQKTCFDRRSQDPFGGDCADSGTAIQPGAIWETHWSGLFYDTTEMPDACYASPPSHPLLRRCVQPAKAVPGPMRIAPRLYATAAALDKGGWSIPTDPILVRKDFLFGTDNLVEVIVE